VAPAYSASAASAMAARSSTWLVNPAQLHAHGEIRFRKYAATRKVASAAEPANGMFHVKLLPQCRMQTTMIMPRTSLFACR
jgi:hypothetical protein